MSRRQHHLLIKYGLCCTVGEAYSMRIFPACNRMILQDMKIGNCSPLALSVGDSGVMQALALFGYLRFKFQHAVQ